jgi:hypothetical protein
MFSIRKPANMAADEFCPYLSDMKNCPAKNYIVSRLLNQINWYDKKSRRNRAGYMAVMIFSVAMSALIPVITLAPTVSSGMDLLVYRLIITAFGWSVTAVSSISAFCRFKELWIQYRTQCELLKSTLYKFFLECSEFKNSPKPQSLLVELCEGYMMKQTGVWSARIPSDGQFSCTGS